MRRSGLATGFLAGLIGLGLGLLLSPFFQPSTLSLGRQVPAGPPEPAWATVAPERDFFRAQLTKIPLDESTDALLARLDRAAAGLLSSEKLELKARASLRRVLASGHEFDSQVSFDAEGQGASGRIRVEVQRAGASPAAFLAEFREGTLVDLSELSPESGSTLRKIEAAAELPIGVGDLQLGDAIGLWAALESGVFEPVGRLEGAASVEMVVVEASFPTSAGPGPAGAAGDFGAQGASALIYLDAADLCVRQLRIFDAKDRLVRVYRDFVYDGREGERALGGFGVRSLPNDSTSLFRIEASTASPFLGPG